MLIKMQTQYILNRPNPVLKLANLHSLRALQIELASLVQKLQQFC